MFASSKEKEFFLPRTITNEHEP